MEDGARQTLSWNPALTKGEPWASDMTKVNIPNFPQLQTEIKILVPVLQSLV